MFEHTLTATALLASVITTAFAVLYQKRSEKLPFIKTLQDELNNIIVGLYEVLDDPSNPLWLENHRKYVDYFNQGNRYFLISNISFDDNIIEHQIKKAGWKIHHFNELKNRYVKTFEILAKVGKSSDPTYKFYEFGDYKNLYERLRIIKNATP